MKSQAMSLFICTLLILVAVSLAACAWGEAATAPVREITYAGTEAVEGAQAAVEASASTLASTPELSPGSDAAWDERSTYRAGLIKAEQAALDSLSGASVYHIELHIPDDFGRLEGHQALRYTNREDEPLDEVYFRTFPNIAGGALTVSALTVDGQEVQPIYEFEGSALRVSLLAALQPGEEIQIEMDFEVEVAREMGGNYGLFGYFEGVLVLDEFFPVIPVYDDEGWNVEAPPPNGDLTYYDASFYRVRVTAPAGLTLVASGIEVERASEGDRQSVVFAAGPARDFYLAAAEDMVVVTEKLGETTVNSYTWPEWEAGAELALEYSVSALESYNQRFGTYPYTEFDVISTPMLALGIEYPGMTAVRMGLYDPDAEVYGLPSQVMLESTVAHEVAHQWFYNGVGNDQVDEPWLDEALVQYVTGLYYLDTYGEAAARSFREGWDWRWNRVNRAEMPIGLPAGAYSEEEYGPIVYGRGPYFVMALAEAMGQETFDEFLRDYYQSHKWGIGTGEAFRQLAEEHCGCDLSDLFEAWVYENTGEL